LNQDWKELEASATNWPRLIDTICAVVDSIIGHEMDLDDFIKEPIKNFNLLTPRQQAYLTDLQKTLTKLNDLENTNFEENTGLRHQEEVKVQDAFQNVFGDKVDRELIIAMDIDHQADLTDKQKEDLKKLQKSMRNLEEISIIEMEENPEARHQREIDLANKMQHLFHGEIDSETDIANLPGLNMNEKAELAELQHELHDLKEMDLDDLKNDPALRHKREDEILDLVKDILGERISSNEFLNMDIDDTDLHVDQKDSLYNLRAELQDLKDLDCLPENMEAQFAEMIEKQQDPKKKNTLRHVKDDFVFHEYELDYDRDARRNLEQELTDYFSNSFLGSKKVAPSDLYKTDINKLKGRLRSQQISEAKEIKNLIDS